MDYRSLNLSSKPFYNFRFLLISVILVYATSIGFSVFTISKLYGIFKLSEDSKIKIENLNKELKSVVQENANLKERIRPIDKKSLVQLAEEINSVIQERNFSWSSLLEDMEKVLPEEVRLLTLATSKSESGFLMVRIIGLSTKREGMLKTIEALKADPSFKNVKPINFQDEEKSSTIGKKFEMQFVYMPKRTENE